MAWLAIACVDDRRDISGVLKFSFLYSSLGSHRTDRSIRFVNSELSGHFFEFVGMFSQTNAGLEYVCWGLRLKNAVLNVFWHHTHCGFRSSNRIFRYLT